MRKKMTAPLSISQIIGSERHSSNLDKQLTRCKIWENWEAIAGANLSKKIKPSRWLGDVLVIKTSNSAWLNELTFYKEEILNRIKESLPSLKIEDIRLEVG